jgi:hypothetical protein
VAASEPPLTLEVAEPNGPVFSDECVEVFVAEPGDPTRYFEVVVNPLGTVYTARVTNPHDSRETWHVEKRPAPEGLVLALEGEPASSPPTAWTRWTCAVRVPWSALSPTGERPPRGEERRGNLYRIARGRTTAFEALSPTLRSAPPDFHVPSRFASFVFA